MNSDIAWGIQFTGNAYRLFNSDDPDTNRPLPGEDGESVDLTTYNVIINSNVIVSFDTWGRPCSDTDGMEPISEEDPTLTLTLNDTDGNSRDITITRNTGYIP